MKKRKGLIILRARHGLTQEEAAKRLDVTRATLSKIECGAGNGRLDFWQRLQKEFNLTDAEVWGLVNNESEVEKRAKVHS